MQIGVFYFPTDYGIDIAELAKAPRGARLRLAVRARAHPYPVQPKDPVFGGGELPKRYAHTHDPFVALAFAAAVTKKLLVGTGIV